MSVNYSFLRPQKALALQRRYDSDFYENEQLACRCYRDAAILPVKKIPGDELLFGRGGVLRSDNTFVKESGISGRVGGFYEFDAPDPKNERVVYCGYLKRHWGHFLIESVARMWYFLENDRTVDKYIFVSEEHGPTELTGNYDAFFKLLGLQDKLEVINRPVRYREVLVPDLGYSRTRYYSGRFKDVFDLIARRALEENPLKEEYPKRIFLSRSQFPKAREAEVGLDLLDHYFSKNGYKILFPEKLSLAQMIAYIRNAEICAAESGSVPHNMLFAKDGQKLVIAKRQTNVNEIQANIDQIRNLDVTYIDAHYTIYPISAGYGPYCFAYNSCLKSFTEEMGYRPPDDSFVSQRAIKKRLKQYMHIYKKAYGYLWGLEEWQLQYADAIHEAYKDSLSDLGSYLNRTEPFRFTQWFEIHYVKQFVRKMLCKFRK